MFLRETSARIFLARAQVLESKISRSTPLVSTPSRHKPWFRSLASLTRPTDRGPGTGYASRANIKSKIDRILSKTMALMLVFFCAFYTVVFIFSTVGNVWVMITCYKTLKRRCFPFMWLVANLASADLLFTLLSLLNAISFLWRWVGGDITCKVQGFLIETTYTTSITTLVIISYKRLKAITDPFNARIRIWPSREYSRLVMIWALCLAVCSLLLYIYRVETNQEGKEVAPTQHEEKLVDKYTTVCTQFFLYHSFVVYDFHTKANSSRSSFENCGEAKLVY